MEQKKFYQTKEGGLTIAFIVIMLAFIVIMLGLNLSNDIVCLAGLLMLAAAMLYSPFKVFILQRRK